jgi:hypothetical protein
MLLKLLKYCTSKQDKILDFFRISLIRTSRQRRQVQLRAQERGQVDLHAYHAMFRGGMYAL